MKPHSCLFSEGLNFFERRGREGFAMGAEGITKIPMAENQTNNPYRGSDFDDFLKEEGIYESVQKKALRQALTEPINDEIKCESNN